MSEKIVFTSRTKNQNIIKHKGATIVTAVPGGTKSEVTPTSWIKFRDHKKITSDPDEIEVIRQHIKNCPSDGIIEVVPKTAQDVLREKEAKALEAMRELEEAKKLAGKPDLMDKVVEGTPEKEEDQFHQNEHPVYEEECSDCDYVAKSSVSQSQARNKLRGHRAGKHKK